tara:strand:+ start:187 stop:465 length:279 start_codon:yes stop_codon:yes gene_type:complete
MKLHKLIFLIMSSYLIFNQFIKRSYADINMNSIINMFCLKNVKAEIIKANLEYKDELGQEICNCYIKNLTNNKSHEKSISDCKIKSKKNFNL